MPSDNDDILFRSPHPSDGYAIHQLIASSPPLDLNSVYSYYLLCSHFRDTCLIAEQAGAVVGFVSAYRPPNQADTLFIWQVVVTQLLRGHSVAQQMLNELLARSSTPPLSYLEATVNPSNIASRRLFERLAHQWDSSLSEQTFLEASAFGSQSQHESETLLRITLNSAPRNHQENQHAHI